MSQDYQIITPGTTFIEDRNFYIIRDHQPPHALGALNISVALGSQNTINELFYAYSINPKEKFFIVEDYLTDDIDSTHKVNLNYFFLNQLTQHYSKIINNSVVDYTKKTNNFNCMMNKFREHRGIISWWIKTKKLTNFTYTQSWEENASEYANAICELLLQETNKLIDVNFLKKHWLGETSSENQTKVVKFGLEGVYNTHLKESFDSSVVSIITEPQFYELGTSIDEKFINAVLGRTIPLIMNYNFSDRLNGLGFELFDDIINLEYQYNTRPVARTLAALESNLELLKSAANSVNFNKSITERLEHNVKVLTNTTDLIKNTVKMNDPENIGKFNEICNNYPALKYRYKLFDNFL